ncbi:amino acid adenylation domain-containing protein [Streptomyces sp. NPDC051567]|uniref:amino acid adenylation domain-containing protein n=1 Tax=Streptomyces sp. NPDC051567 TaxID=3365660 RepID=UPI00379AD3A3
MTGTTVVPVAVVGAAPPPRDGGTRAAAPPRASRGRPLTTRGPVHEAVRAVARTAPGTVAVATDDTSLDYAGLQARAAAVTRELRARGVGPGAPVAVRMANGPDRAAALLGTFAAGAYAVCLNPGRAGDRDREALTAAAPLCLLTDPVGADDTLPAWYREQCGGQVLEPAALTPVPGTGEEPPHPGGPGDPWAYLTHTSGSTGTPKGIPQTHRTLAQFVGWFAREFRIGPGSRVAQWASPGYDASLVEMFAALASGATLCPVPDRIRAHPEKLAAWLVARRITHFQTVPSFGRALLGAIGTTGLRPTALGHLLLAGEPLHGELANGLRTALPGVRMVNLYGATETILATWHEISGPQPQTVPAGLPVPGRRILVLDEHDRPCPPGTTGSIVVHSPYITPGYTGGKGQHDDAFRPVDEPFGAGPADGRYYRSGDLGRLRRDGVLEFAGRGDSRIKFYGVRMELTDIEAALAADESVTDCAVVAHTGPDALVSRLIAYVVPAPSREGLPAGTSALWRAVLRRRFGKSMLPVAFRTLTALPRNVGGKVDRRSLVALDQAPG